MSIDAIVQQDANYLPPVLGEVVSVEVDATWRIYDIGSLGFGGRPTRAQDQGMPGDAYFDVVSTVACFIAFASATGGSPSATDRTAAGGTLAKSATAAVPLAAGERVRWRLSRVAHRYVHLYAASGGTVRFHQSSNHAR